MSTRTGVGLLGLMVLLILGGVGMARTWRKPAGYHRAMVTTTYGWLRIAMPARWALYRAMPVLWVAMAVFWLDMVATMWLEGGNVTLHRLASGVAQWGVPVTGILLLVALSVFLVSRPRFLIFPALRPQPNLIKVWGNHGMSPEEATADHGEVGPV